jgi:hypothetical protein
LVIARDRALTDVDDEEPMPDASQPRQKSNRKG